MKGLIDRSRKCQSRVICFPCGELCEQGMGKAITTRTAWMFSMSILQSSDAPENIISVGRARNSFHGISPQKITLWIMLGLLQIHDIPNSRFFSTISNLICWKSVQLIIK